MDVYADHLMAALHAQGCTVSAYVPWCPRLSARAGIAVTHTWRTLVYPLLARQHEGEVNHVVDHSYGHLVHHLDADRTVVTCHDVAPLVCPDPAARGVSVPLWRLAFRGMLRARHIIADSESTRRELLRYAPDMAERTTVVPLGVDHGAFHPRGSDEQHQVRVRYRLPEGPVVLHVGHCGHRKNIENLLEAFAALRQRGVVATLVQSGGRFTASQRMMIADLGLDRWVRQIPFAAAQDLPALYTLADVFVFPSWYEGFGLPVLEAMASGTPVICSGTSSLPEVAGEAAWLIDPGDAQDLARAMERILTDARLSEYLRQQGKAHAKRFSWERCARDTMAVYALVADER